MAAEILYEESLEKGLRSINSRVRKLTNSHHQFLKSVEAMGNKMDHLQSTMERFITELCQNSNGKEVAAEYENMEKSQQETRKNSLEYSEHLNSHEQENQQELTALEMQGLSIEDQLFVKMPELDITSNGTGLQVGRKIIQTKRKLSCNIMSVDKPPKEINEKKIKDDKAEKEMEATVVDGNGTKIGHIILTTIGGKNGKPKHTISYTAERIVGQGSFGIVFQAKCLETGETVVIKKVLQDKRYKNRELQTMSLLDHPNVVSLKHCFFSTTEKEELYLDWVLKYVLVTAYRISRHYSKANQRMPMIYVKLNNCQIFRALTYIHGIRGLPQGHQASKSTG